MRTINGSVTRGQYGSCLLRKFPSASVRPAAMSSSPLSQGISKLAPLNKIITLEKKDTETKEALSYFPVSAIHHQRCELLCARLARIAISGASVDDKNRTADDAAAARPMIG